MKSTRSKKQVLILGAGLAGLTAAYELVKAGYKVILLEKEDAVGGLARTIERNGFRFDTGPHRWYTKNDMVNGWMLRLLGDEVIEVPRLTRIYFDNKFFHYPIKIKSTLQGMGILKTLLAVLDYGFIRMMNVFYKKEPITLEDGYINKFGRTLYLMFFKRYSEKLWGTSCRNISADWIGQRTRGFNVATIIKSALFESGKVVSFVDKFSYPKRGIGRIAEKLAESILSGGGKIYLGSEVTKIERDHKKIKSVTVKSGKKIKTIKGDEIVSTIALSDLVAGLYSKVTREIEQVNLKLTYRDELQIALFINKTKVTPDTWVYIHSLELPYVRFMEMDNWSNELSPAGTTTILFEIACNVGDETWKKNDKEIVKLIADSFIKEFGLISKSDVLGAYVHRIPKEYPVYHVGYKKDVAYLKHYLKQLTNLQLAGRNGTFRYNNMDHSIEMGLYAAWNIIEGERKFDIESVNIEREYLEEKQVKSRELELPDDEYVETKPR